MASDEADRIQRVYTEYQRSGKWNNKNSGFQRMLRERNTALDRILAKRLPRPLSECRILDVGCGKGDLLDFLQKRGAQPQNLFGIDIQPDKIEMARQTHSLFDFQVANAEHLGFPDSHFDVVLLFTVFSSILDETIKRNIALDVTRVLQPDGVILWYDIRYPNPQNPNVRAMTRGSIRSLFQGFDANLEPLTLLPPIAYRLGSFTRSFYGSLASLRFLRSHYIGSLKRVRA
jgi:ubiquinone/menaquinone biosynthesis C-methylase UbiE